MKLPLSWMRDFVSIDAPVEEISRRLSFAGLVVENVEKLAPGSPSGASYTTTCAPGAERSRSNGRAVA